VETWGGGSGVVAHRLLMDDLLYQIILQACQIQYNQPMSQNNPISGVIVAAVTPLLADASPDLASIPLLMDHLRARGCHGALLLGTTGEGPSFSPSERAAILQAAADYRRNFPDFRLLAGTGTPSMQETIDLTCQAFDLGYDGVVVLPPYYFRKASDDGLFAWYSQVILQAVPAHGQFYGYHIPDVSGVGLSFNMLGRLLDAFPDRFMGIKDSTGDATHARALGERFGQNLRVFNGNDRLFSLALDAGAVGCITALANLCSPWLRQVWDAHQTGAPRQAAQTSLDAARTAFEKYPPAPPTLKMVLARRYHLPAWTVRPPLLPLAPNVADQAAGELDQVL
jgi:4-hydroxy-tetrahydrodipicolinate synthase